MGGALFGELMRGLVEGVIFGRLMIGLGVC